MNILQVNSSNSKGGAARVAWTLHQGYQVRGHQAWLAVGYKNSSKEGVFALDNANAAPGKWAQFWWGVHGRLLPHYGRFRGVPYHMNQLIQGLAAPQGLIGTWQGRENFHFPASQRLLSSTPETVDILHLHNLHRNYFDLTTLPQLSEQAPTVLSLHDMWTLTGHCAHSFACERWQSGCGSCPDLTIYPAIRRDATAVNWQHKQAIYAHSHLYLTAPSHWLMEKAKQSMLWAGVAEAKVIPHGIDLTLFHPQSKQAVREKLGLPNDATIILFAANGIRHSPWRDYQMMREVIAQVADRLPDRAVQFIALGENGTPEQIGNGIIHFVPYQDDPHIVANYYQAADIYLHVSKADVFPLVVLEALACGTPVVATAVGGIPEQVNTWKAGSAANQAATGILTPPGNAIALAEAVEKLLREPDLHRHLSANAAQDARSRFDFQRQLSDYLAWYDAIRAKWHTKQAKRGATDAE